MEMRQRQRERDGAEEEGELARRIRTVNKRSTSALAPLQASEGAVFGSGHRERSRLRALPRNKRAK
jgi:hypothetical protein